MKAVRAVVLGALVVAVAGPGRADDKKDEKDYAKKLLGKWEITKAGNPNGAQAGSILEFLKDGKYREVIVGKDGQKQAGPGSYRIEKDKVVIKTGPEGQEFEEALAITKLTDDAMELTDKDGGVDVLKRVKDKDKKDEKKDK
ncbi:MAG: hypothetical protein K2X82_14245 [Gemmataceae bacterium]|nr:hypothetical protein [Gemmataceae bacterium]